MFFNYWLSRVLLRFGFELPKERVSVRRRPLRTQLELLEDRIAPAVFVVTTTQNGGEGSLRQAILDANDQDGPDFITFSIPGVGVQTITPNIPLPEITETVIINATTQPGWTPVTPMIALDGHLAGLGTSGLRFQVGGNTVQGLAIHSFDYAGILLREPEGLTSTGGNTIQFNLLGTDATGTVAKGNEIGLQVSRSPNNIIKYNLISGNRQSGIELDYAETTGNIIQANNIGGNVSGDGVLGNGFNGIFIGAPDVPNLRQHPESATTYASGNLIGGLDLDLGNEEPLANMIVGNKHAGIFIFRGGENQVQGNYIGINQQDLVLPNGTAGVGAEFGSEGILIEEGHDNEIGGVEAGAGNVISGNTGAGVAIRAIKRYASDNVIQGNRIGTDTSGHYQEGLGNQTNGIEITNTTEDLSGEVAAGNYIGGYDSLDGAVDGEIGARNIISGNGKDGILIAGHFMLHTIVGNYIGVDIDGTGAAPNGRDGIRLSAFAGQDVDSSVTIIGSADFEQEGAENVISGNVGNGIFIGFGTKAHVFRNAIGVNKDVSAPIGNGGNGIQVSFSSGNEIGGVVEFNGETKSVGNVIAANGNDGVQINSSSSENSVIGNVIGLGAGPGDFGNLRHGVAIISSPNNHVGNGTETGRNVIVNNKQFGLLITGLDSEHNTVKGNYIGVDADGTTVKGNETAGVVIFEASDNTIGGESGQRNLISGNQGAGVRIEGGQENKVLGNSIGSDVFGEFHEGLGNLGSGVIILNSKDNTLKDNYISGNAALTGSGIAISGAGATGNKVESNRITHHALRGVSISNEASDNFIGGTEADTNNYILTNGDGVMIDGHAHDNHVINNFIGNDGAEELNEENRNTQSGIFIVDAHSNELQGNVIRGNADGIVIAGETAHDNTVRSNRITNNSDYGVHITVSAYSNKIGGILEEHRNLISANAEGVHIDSLAHDNLVSQNFIGTDPEGVVTEDSGNTGAGVLIVGAIGNQVAENKILGNVTGVSISGAEAKHNIVDENTITHNTARGVHLLDGASENSIGLVLGNLISVNPEGVVIEGGAHDNSVNGNRIGTNAAGAFEAGFGNAEVGISILDARANTVRGNTIRGSLGGISIAGDANQIFNNTITNNHDEGILIFSEAANNVIGGRPAGSSNIITNNGAGIRLDTGAHHNEIIDNRIGTNVAGDLDASLGNSGPGISILDAHHMTIEGNVIRSNTTGVSIAGSTSRSNVVRDNVITNNSEHGVAILAGATDNAIGGVGTDDFNRISENLKSGVIVVSGFNNSIRRNRIFGNFSLGIDLGDNGPTPNEKLKDNDSGPNQLQNYPQLTLATSGATQRIVGTLSSTPSSTFILEFFATAAPDSSAFGEAERFVTTATVITNASGIASFDVPLPTGDIGGTFLTATATDANGNTSEFAKTIKIETDGDGDGISDNMEDGGQNGGDANQDGIPDRQQTNVTSFKTVFGEVVTLAAPAGVTFSQVTPIENPSPDDAPQLAFDIGFFGYQLNGLAPGAAVTVELILQTNKTPQTYMRYGPLPGTDTPIWYEWLYNGATGAEINGNRIRLHFIDGDFGDDDLIANGVIVDPGGPAFPLSTTVTNTNDSGPGSLRQAILNANDNFGPDTIDFQIGSGVQTIMPLTTLPVITDAVTIDGTTQPGFGSSPIIVLSGQFAPGTGLAIAAPHVTIRGLVINQFPGIAINIGQLNNQTPVDFRIEGNYIGTDVTGLQAMPNAYGIDVKAGSGIIGGTTVAARNVLSGNMFEGVGLGHTVGIQVKGNYIGVAADGVSPLGNGEDGVAAALIAEDVMIGGLEAGAGNIIAYNARAGVEIWLADQGVSILSNQIYSNGIMGINVIYGPVTDLNDNGLEDGTPGKPQNFPVVSSAISTAGTTTITGHLQSRPNRTYVVQLFSSAEFLKSGYGEGETFLGSVSVTTDANGHADYSETFNVATADGRVISATATDTVSGNTSEFSIRLTVNDVLGSVFTVNTTDDVDDGVADATHTSLREAILAANNHPGPDTIRFAIGSGVQTIAPLIPLPAVTDAVVIDGTTQPGFAGTPVIEIVGTSMQRGFDAAGTPAPLYLTGLYVNANDSTIRGLAINSFYEFNVPEQRVAGRPLAVYGDNNLIVGNFIGTDVTGTVARRTLDPTLVVGTGNRIGGTTVQDRNLFAAGELGGLQVGGNGNVIQGNFIGTDITGTKALGNGRGVDYAAVQLTGELYYLGSGGPTGANIFGGTEPGAGNLVSGNSAKAIHIFGGDGSVIQGNLIGTDITGTKMLGNSGGITAEATGEARLLIGGTDPAARNIISNGSTGIVVSGTGVVVQGNYIGTDITGAVDFGNNLDGIEITGSGHVIGGTAPGAGNLISGNGRHGIFLQVLLDQASFGNRIQGNRIGTKADGVSPLGNGADGIIFDLLVIPSRATVPYDNLIGGLEAGAGNIIAFNAGNGVSIVDGERNGIFSNSIFSNGGLGIDLNGDGVTANDSGDLDSGSHNLQNFPVLATAATDGVKTTVSGTVNTTPNTALIIQVFASPSDDPSGFGEGQLLLGSRYVLTDATGNVAFTFVFPVAVPAGQQLTATATDLENNTSEFSHAFALSAGPVPANQPPTAFAGGPYTIDEGDSLSLFTPSDDFDGDPITISWDINGDGVFGDATGRALTLTWAQLQALGIVNGPSAFDVRVRVDDGQGHVVTSSATSLTVRNVKPVVDAGETSRFVYEGSQIDFTGTFTDPGSADTHTLLWQVTASNGQVIADGHDTNFSFVPNDNGTYTVTFTVTDSDQESDSVVINVDVFNVEPAVQIIGLPEQGTVGVPMHLTSLITDPSSVDQAAGVRIEWSAYLDPEYVIGFTGTETDFTFTPTEAGLWQVSLLVFDKDFSLGMMQVYLEVLPADGGNHAPVFSSPATFNVPENSNTVGTVVATDVDLPAQFVDYSITGGADASKFAIDSNGHLIFTSAPDFEDPKDVGTDNVYNVQVTANDGHGGTTTQNITVTVTAVNDNDPIFTSPATFNVPENTTAVGTMAAFDDDLPAEIVTFSISGGPDAARFVLSNGGTLSFVTAPDFENPADAGANNIYELQVQASDGNGGVSTRNITVTVTSVNDNLPVFTSPATFSVAENTNAVGTVVATDADSPSQFVDYSITGGADASKFSVDSNGNLIFTSAPDFENPQDADGDDVYNLQVSASDGNGGSTSQNITVTVTAVNDNDPIFTSPANFNVVENTTAVGTMVATDADLPAQLVTFTISGGPDAAQFVITSGGVLSFVTAPDFENPTDAGANNVYDLQVAANDGAGRISTRNITVRVASVNNTAPTFTSPATFSVAENSNSVGTVVATDADLPAQFVNYSITGGADANKFAIDSTGHLIFTSAADFENPQDADGDNVYQVQVTADDGNGGATTQDITVTVTAVNDNDPIITSAATFNMPENSTAVGMVTATDADLPAQGISFSITGGLDAARFVISNEGVLTFAVAPDFEQPADANGDNIYELQVTVTDGLGGLTVQDITVTVTDVNDDVPAPHLDLGASATFIKKHPPVTVLPQIVVSGTSVLEGGSLVLSMNLVGSKKKLLDQLVLPNHSQLGSSTGPQLVNRHLTLEIQLNSAATNASIQAFLRGITFATKGKGLKTPTRNMQITLTDSSGASSTVNQTINVRRK